MVLLDLPDDTQLDGQIARCLSDSGVLFAHPDVLIPAAPAVQAAATDDPGLGIQWHLATVRAGEAWVMQRGSPDVVVAVLDSGVDVDHADLQGQYAWGLDTFAGDDDPTDTNGHGTHCAGIIGAATDNAVGIAGSGWDCRLAAYRCGEGAGFLLSDLLEGIGHAVDRGAYVLSMSWGSYNDYTALHIALGEAAAAGCVLVAAAGNDSQDVPFYPAAYPEVIGVAASAPNDTRSLFSNHGAWVSVAAPGQSIYSTWHDGDYRYQSGTSMACPLVAGLAALLYAQTGVDRGLGAASTVRNALEAGTVDVGNWVAAGRVDFVAALESIAAAGAPVVTGLSPADMDALGHETVSVSGSGFTGADSLLVGSQAVDLSVVNDGLARFVAPPAQTLGAQEVVVLHGAQASAPLNLTYNETDPARLLAPALVKTGESLRWQFGAHPGDAWLLLVSFDPQTALLQGQPVLTQFVVGRAGLADDAGLGEVTVGVPAALAGLDLYSQVVSGPGHFAAATPVATTRITP